MAKFGPLSCALSPPAPGAPGRRPWSLTKYGPLYFRNIHRFRKIREADGSGVGSAILYVPSVVPGSLGADVGRRLVGSFRLLAIGNW